MVGLNCCFLLVCTAALCTVALLLCCSALLPLCLGTITREYPHGHLLLVALGIGKTRGMVLEEAGFIYGKIGRGELEGERSEKKKSCLFTMKKFFFFFRFFNSRILRAAKKTSFSDACVRLLRWFQWVVVGNCGRSGEKVWNEGGMQDRVRVRVRVWDWDWDWEIGDWITNADVRGGYKRGCWVYVYKDLL